MIQRDGRRLVALVTLLGLLVLAAPAPWGHAQSSLQSDLEDYLVGRPGSYGVAVENLTTGETALINAYEPMLAASTYKVLVMYRVYQQVAAGMLRMDDPVTIIARDTGSGDGVFSPGETTTVANALEAMITLSDNVSAWALARTVGGWSVVTSAAPELGMSQTSLEGSYYYTTAADMLVFFTALAKGELVNADASEQMIALLGRQTRNDRIPAGLPEGVTVAHKTGELGGVRNDAGIVYAPGGPYVIAVLANGASEDDLVETSAQISRMVYERFVLAEREPARPEPPPTVWSLKSDRPALDAVLRLLQPWDDLAGRR